VSKATSFFLFSGRVDVDLAMTEVAYCLALIDPVTRFTGATFVSADMPSADMRLLSLARHAWVWQPVGCDALVLPVSSCPLSLPLARSLVLPVSCPLFLSLALSCVCVCVLASSSRPVLSSLATMTWS
jgi:hypothetical protein